VVNHPDWIIGLQVRALPDARSWKQRSYGIKINQQIRSKPKVLAKVLPLFRRTPWTSENVAIDRPTPVEQSLARAGFRSWLDSAQINHEQIQPPGIMKGRRPPNLPPLRNKFNAPGLPSPGPASINTTLEQIHSPRTMQDPDETPEDDDEEPAGWWKESE
jgi:hypothetical protein